MKKAIRPKHMAEDPVKEAAANMDIGVEGCKEAAGHFYKAFLCFCKALYLVFKKE